MHQKIAHASLVVKLYMLSLFFSISEFLTDR